MSGRGASAHEGGALRVLVAHNAYRHAGGEDSVVESEVALLREHGHTVIEMRRDNADVEAIGRLPLLAQTLWSRRTQAEARALIALHRPHVAHIHNTLPLLSPSLHWACAEAGVAVVQTLHNFRLACPQAMFLRDGQVCEDCLGRAPLPAIRHGCYRGSRAQTAVVATMLVAHRAIGTWRDKVDRFVALTEFSRDKFIQAGIAPERIAVKPNFVDSGPRSEGHRQGFLFVGRLSKEKGTAVLARACLASPEFDLRVVGSGPEAHRLDGIARLTRLGTLDTAAVHDEMGRATALVVPSICFETFGRVVVEAYARGTAVIASRIGSLAELVEHEVTGLLFRPGDSEDLARTLQWAMAHPELMGNMGRRARERYDALYTPAANCRQLIAIYREAIASRRSIEAGE
jgi:glycosyltransferase involved in cell wall biosynthesis